MYNHKLSSVENVDNFVNYLNNNVHDRDAEKTNKIFKNFMYIVGAIFIIKLIMREE
jgi:hypothetical protein